MKINLFQHLEINFVIFTLFREKPSYRYLVQNPETPKKIIKD
jgi:hypothetical protein